MSNQQQRHLDGTICLSGAHSLVSSYENVIAGQHEELAHLADELRASHPTEVEQLTPWLEKLADACDDLFEVRTDAFEEHDLPLKVQAVTQVWSKQSAELIRQTVQALANGITDNMKNVMKGEHGLNISAPTVGPIGLHEAEEEIVAKVTPIVRLATEKAYMEAVTALNTSYYELFKQRFADIRSGKLADVPAPPQALPVVPPSPAAAPAPSAVPAPPPRRKEGFVAQEVADHLSTCATALPPPVGPSPAMMQPAIVHAESQMSPVSALPQPIRQPTNHPVPVFVQPVVQQQTQLVPIHQQQQPIQQTVQPISQPTEDKKKKESFGTKFKNLFKKEPKETKQASPQPRTPSQLLVQEAPQRRSMDQASISSKGDRTSVYSISSATHSVSTPPTFAPPPIVPPPVPQPIPPPPIVQPAPQSDTQPVPPPVAPRHKEGMVAVLPTIPESSPVEMTPAPIIVAPAQTVIAEAASNNVPPSPMAESNSPTPVHEEPKSRPSSIVAEQAAPAETGSEKHEGEEEEEELVKPKKFVPTGAMAALAGVMVSGGPSQLKKRPAAPEPEVESFPASAPAAVLSLPTVAGAQPTAPEPDPPAEPFEQEQMEEISVQETAEPVTERPAVTHDIVTLQEAPKPPPVVPRKKAEPAVEAKEDEVTSTQPSPTIKSKTIAFEDDKQVIHAAVEWLNRHQQARQVTADELFEYVVYSSS